MAEEVRKLAEESQTAAEKIGGLVKTIQFETNNAVTVVEDGAHQTEEAAGTVERARDAFQRIGEAVDQAVRRQSRIGAGVALLFIDMDSFKAVNDLHGHSLGDDVLKQAAQRLRTTLRDADAIARLRRLARRRVPPPQPTRHHGARADDEADDPASNRRRKA